MRFIACLLLSAFLSSCGPTQGYVVSVIDGDTYVVKMTNGALEHVRVVGIDTPETVDPNRPVGCFGPEASAEAKELLTGKDVTLVKKPDEDRDKYHRLLRYVMLGKQDVGAFLISEGYARSYTWFPHPRIDQYNALQAQAKAEGKGLWSACGNR